VTSLLDTRPRKAYALEYNLVIVPKRREPALSEPRVAEIRDVIEGIVDEHGCTVRRLTWEPDHLHLRFGAEPGTDLPTFINAAKTTTSRRLRTEFPGIGDRFEKGFWEPGYVIGSVDRATLDDLVSYAEERYAWPGNS